MPQCIGLVTSKTGAALQDVIHIITRRWPMVKLLLAPVSVQGLEAEKSIVDGIRRLDADPRPDIILITRGGGSKEDLWVFNSERIARAAYACKSQSFLRSGMKLIPQFWIMWLTCVLLHLPQRRNSACRIRHRCGTKYSFYNKIFKNIQSRLEMCYNKFNIISPAAAMQNEKQELTPVRSFCGKRQHRYRPLQPKRQLPAPRAAHRCCGGSVTESICSPCTRLYHGRGCPRPLPDNRTSEAGAEDHCYRQQCSRTVYGGCRGTHSGEP